MHAHGAHSTSVIPLAAVSQRIAGLLLFLPVPVVLALLTRQPLGPWPSLALGLLVTRRTGSTRGPSRLARGRPLPVVRRAGRRGAEARAARAGRRRPRGARAAPATGDSPGAPSAGPRRTGASSRLGILGTLAAFLVMAVAVASGSGRGIEMADAVAVFRLGVALSVLPLGWLGPSRGTGRAPTARCLSQCTSRRSSGRSGSSGCSDSWACGGSPTGSPAWSSASAEWRDEGRAEAARPQAAAPVPLLRGRGGLRLVRLDGDLDLDLVGRRARRPCRASCSS